MTKQTAYILRFQGFSESSTAVIFVKPNDNLDAKIMKAIQEEKAAESIESITYQLGDWGEPTTVKAVYVEDGEQITDDDITLTKTVSY